MVTTNLLLISENWKETSSGTELHFFGRSPDYGVIELIFTNEHFIFFIKRDTDLPKINTSFERKKIEYKTFKNEPVDSLTFKSYKSLKLAEKAFQEQNIQCFESDILPTRRFLMKHYINCELAIQGNLTTYKNRYQAYNPKIKPFESNYSALKTASIDIEMQVSTNRLYSIAVHGTYNTNYSEIVFIQSDQTNYNGLNVVKCESETEILNSFINYIKEYGPDIIIGWNVIGFDLTFLSKKAEQLNLKFSLGRSSDIPFITSNPFGGAKCKLNGRVVIDGPTALRTSFYSFKDFSLGAVSHELLGEKNLLIHFLKKKLKKLMKCLLIINVHWRCIT